MLATTAAIAQPAVPPKPEPVTAMPAASTPDATAPASPQILSAGDAALYRQVMLAVADRIYRLAVAHSTKKIRHHHKTITVAIVTNIPAPSGVGRRGGGYEDLELREPVPSSDAARAVMPAILAAIKDGQPDQALAQMQSVQANCTPADNAVMAHRIAASFRAEGRDADAYKLAMSVSDPSVPQLMWDAGFAAYRLGDWANAEAQLEKLAETPGAQNSLRAQGAFWAARAHMQSGDPLKVVTLLNFAADKVPSFYGMIAERMLGIDTQSGFADAIINQSDFHDLMAVASAHRAVALWQIGETDYVGPELNRAFVNNDERLDPAMAALARGIGVPNVELRASEASAARGLMLTGLFPVPPYRPDGGYRIDSSLVLAFARIESRFQTQAVSPVGARGLMQIMPETASHLGVSDPATLYDPGISLEVGQRYLERLLLKLDGNLLELGGAYNAGPQAVDRWRTTKAGGDDPLLFVESIPVAETRSYVKRLMLYHWLYRRRFGQDARSLEETASGQWPTYQPYQETVPGGSPAYGLKINAKN